MPAVIPPDQVLARWFKDPRQEPIVLTIDRCTAFALMAQMQLALRNPNNTGEPAAIARHFIQQIQSILPEEIYQFARLGDDPAFDGAPPRRCRSCGCTDDRACILDGQPCSWVEPDLCSACAPTIIL